VFMRRRPLTFIFAAAAGSSLLAADRPFHGHGAAEHAVLSQFEGAAAAVSRSDDFPQLAPLRENWQTIRDEGLVLITEGAVKAADGRTDAAFNSFFRTGWKRFYLAWYGRPHPSALERCPKTMALLSAIPDVKAAMFALLPPGARLGRHRDPYAGSLRYHLGLLTPNSDDCFIEVDGERRSWRDGDAFMFDETYIHQAENRNAKDRLILFCDVRPAPNNPVARLVDVVFGR